MFLFDPVEVPGYSTVRFDTAQATDSPAVVRLAPAGPVLAGGLLRRSDPVAGMFPAVWSDVETLWQKTIFGGVVVATVQITGGTGGIEPTPGAGGGGGGAPVNSPAFTGTPTAPTPPTTANSVQIATTAFVHALVEQILDGAPGALDTLDELAAAIGDDANFAATVTAAIAARVPATRTVAGKALSADISLVKADVGLGSVDNTADSAKPVSTAQQAAINGRAPLASPTFTGTPAAPTATAGTNTTQLATTAFVTAAVSALIAAAPGALDTLDELAAALGDDANFAATMTTALNLRATTAQLDAVKAGITYGPVIKSGGAYPAPPAGYRAYQYVGDTDPALQSSPALPMPDGSEWAEPVVA